MSMMRCDGCDMSIDTDHDPEAFLADGEVCLCCWCRDVPEVGLRALWHALRALKDRFERDLKTDNAFANSGRMARASRRINALRREHEAAKGDYDAWLENQ